ncbi:hypothetical protein EZ428_12815 [Pedobacter frigiditerrae]|uniref:MG2 domain-containing protein n=1 Tax=Pedobacter frigiditerrae TaxID=2530452 RepID=A0A4R0MVD2_9SPHI|nr:hypothetical protein [Pedobacter frigiditerrae]TCC90162.1 hypothetical protein EZ428_12815 [Pedobacter frigiditerrae]
MRKVFSRITVVFLLMYVHSSIKAQVLEKVQNAFTTYQKNVFQEKMFIHTDKEQYLAGEVLWLKIYIVDANQHQPADLSKVAYIELLDQLNQPVKQLKISLKNGSGNGAVELPKTLKNGSYRLRGYTNWMKNFDVALFFEKKITLLNAQISPAGSNLAKRNFNIQFFAEGGDLVEGLKSNVGFKAVGENGRGLDLAGAIVNQKNDTIVRFKPSRFGIGKFPFTPEPNMSYRAIITSLGKEKIEKEFLTAKKIGYVMSVNKQKDGNLIVDLNSSMKNEKVYLLSHHGKNISNVIATDVIGGKASFFIETAKLDEGVSHFTIFNEAGTAICERLFFKLPNKKLDIQLTTDQSQYSLRKKVDVNVLLKNPIGIVNSADLSVSVHKIDSLQGIDESDIMSYFWLVSELKGYVESPSYYFTNSEEAYSDLNNLLITQGWRRFNWSDVMQSKKPEFKFLPEYNGHLIKGKVKEKNGKTLNYANVYLGSAGKIGQFYEALSDTAGNFTFNTKDFYGLNEIVVQTNQKDTSAIITIQSPFFEKYSIFNVTDFKFSQHLIDQFENYNMYTQVQHTYNPNKFNSSNGLVTDSVTFYGKAFKSYKFNDYDRFNTMEESLREVVKETFISKSEDGYRIKLLAKDVPLDDDPLVLLDGLPYFNMDKVMAIDPNKIERLEIVPESYHYGSSKFDGILSFFSFKSNLANIEINPNSVVLDYDGLQLKREFYNPSYDSESQMNNRLPDFRNVLYWSPNISINDKGEGKITFYTSDVAGTYIGIINGLSNNGNVGNAHFTFKVNEKIN